MKTSLIFDIVVVFVAALTGGYIADRLKQSPIIGYILGGIMVGPHVFGLVADVALVQEMAELGVILLMFTLGIEFSLSRLDKVKSIAVVGGIIQILIVIVLGIIVGHKLGFTLYESAFLGCALAISSTMIVLRSLSDRGELSSTHSQIMMGILIVQDLSVIIMVSLLPHLHSFSGEGLSALLLSIGKTALFVAAMLYLSGKVVPAFLDRAAKSSSSEIFLLVALSLGLGIAALSHGMGLSVSLGAFIAGLVISESEYTHEIMGKIVSFRDAFVVLFFVSVGMLVNPRSFIHDWPAVLVVLTVIILGKFVVVYLIVRTFGYHNRIALYSGMGLLQTGEFSIVLAQIGLGMHLIPTSLNDIILSTAIISILLTPFFIKAAPSIYAYLISRKHFQDDSWQLPSEDISVMNNHVILCGYGRVGRHIGEALKRLEIPFVVIDYDHHVLKSIKQEGIPFIYGDSSNEIVLSHASPQTAAMAILALPDIYSNQHATRNLLRYNPDIFILARAHSNLEKEILYKLGVHEVIQPETEAGLQMIWHMMFKLNLPREKIESYVAYMFENDYQRIVSAHSDGREKVEALRVKEFSLPDDAPWINKPLKESFIRELTGCNVVSIRKLDGTIRLNPQSHELIEEGDQIIVMGTSSQLLEFINQIRGDENGKSI
ncbi:MAG: cation:proton antiporter [Candidatus Saccharibacteria bacterium]